MRVPLMGILLLLVAQSFVVTSAQAARQFSSQRECATCHIMWLNDFKRKDVATLIPYDPKPKVRTGRQDVASTERMCFSCHDGFMLDSREAWQNPKHQHPVGVKPSHNVHIPTSKGKTVFPLNDDGKVYCGTCHTAHGVDWKQTESPVFMRARNTDSAMCLACHLSRGTGPKEGNHPLFRRPPASPVKLLAAGGRLAGDGTVICQSCHQPHGAPEDKLLVLSNQGSQLCQNCHRDKRQVVRSKHDMSIMAPELENRKGMPAKSSGPCVVCHVPHNAKGPALWARERVKDAPPQSAACLGCHNPNGPAKKKLPGTHSHPIGVDVADLGITVKAGQWASPSPLLPKAEKLLPLPLYDHNGLKGGKGTRIGCGSCHDPHVWSVNREVPDGTDPKTLEGDTTTSFLRIAAPDPSKLCINCHVNKRSIAMSKHNPSVMHPKDKETNGKKTTGLCQTCHMPHQAKGPALWARTRGSAKTPIAALCTDCHRKGHSGEKKQTGMHSHPLGVQVAGIKGHHGLPLFNEQGERTDKDGRVDCASCHNPHQWDPANPVSVAGADARVEGTGQTSFLRVAAGGSSKLCLQCHADKQPVIGTEHDLNVTAADAVNRSGQTVNESGPCGQCHVPHNAETDNRLWARKALKAGDPAAGLCLSCHQSGGVAGNKIPAEYTHPESIKVWSGDVRKHYESRAGSQPVYDEHGKRDKTGRITCVTCHNPHQWQPGSPANPGKPVEGDVTNSFLRLKSTERFVCADCHGKDALYRYKYFHSKTSREAHRLFD